jgi:hypothetical protein
LLGLNEIKYWVVVPEVVMLDITLCYISCTLVGSSGKQTTVLLELSIPNARVSGDILTAVETLTQFWSMFN